MHARRLRTPEERLQYEINAATCFHGALDAEKNLEELRNKPDDRELWGAFDDEGEILATLLNNHYTMRFDGHEIRVGGIGGVATPPENRYGGAIRHIFAQLLPAVRADGEVFSFLQPFSHAFYRRFGYELCHIGQMYTFESTQLKGFVHSGWTRRYREGDPIRPYLELWNAYTERYALPMLRDEQSMREKLGAAPLRSRLTNPNADRVFSYLIGEYDSVLAYVTFADVRHDPAAQLVVSDCAFTGRKGLYALLGFLARFTADYGEISLRLPEDICLPSLLDESIYPPHFTVQPQFNYMGRVVNVPEALRLMKKPTGYSFVIAVQDEYLPANEGKYLVTDNGVSATDLPEDIFLNVHALAPLLLGLGGLSAAEMRPDVEILGNRETLEKVFVPKPQLMTEFF